MRGRLGITTALLALGLIASNPRAASELLRLPDLETTAMEETVVAQLTAARLELAELSRKGGDGEALAAAWGEVGRLHLAYQLLDAAGVAFGNARELGPGDSRWAYYAGVVADRGGDAEPARAAFASSAELDPSCAACWIRLGRAAFAAGNLEEARRAFTAARPLPGAAPAAQHGLGLAARDAGELEDALRLLLAALAAQPQATSLHYPIAQLHRQLGDLDAARRHLGQRGDGEVAFPDPLLDELADLTGGAAALLERGLLALERGDLSQARAALTEAAAADPGDGSIVQVLASVEARRGDRKAAIAAARRAVELDPASARSRALLADLLVLERESADEAEGLLREALALEPALDDAHRTLGLLLARQGRCDAARDELAPLLSRSAGDRQAALALARCIGDRTQAEAVVGSLERLVAASPADAEAQVVLARLLAEEGRAADAAGRYLAHAAGAPAEVARVAGRVIGDALGRDGLYREAATVFAAALAISPEAVALRFQLATAQMLAGDPSAARRTLEDGLARNPDDARLQRALAELAQEESR